MKKTTLLLLAASSLIAAGCGKIARPDGRGSAILPSVSASSLTKGVTTTTNNLGTFGMKAVTGPYIDHTISETVQQPGGVYFNAFVKKTGTGASASWGTYATASATATTDYYWINGNDIVFWSWYPLDLTTAATGILALGTPVVPPTTGYNTLGFDYTLPTHVDGSDASNQRDLIFAGNVESRTFEDGTDNITAHTSTNTDYTRNDNQIDIVFHHALAKIQFGVDLSDNTFNKSLKIKKIELSNLRSTGTGTFTAPNTFGWNDPATGDKNTWSQSFGTGGVDFSSYGSASPSLPTDWPLNSSNSLYICDNAFFLIPQKINEGTVQMTITFDLGGTEISKTADIPEFTWTADHYYTYKIKAQGDSASLSLSISLADWSERENYIPIY